MFVMFLIPALRWTELQRNGLLTKVRRVILSREFPLLQLLHFSHHNYISKQKFKISNTQGEKSHHLLQNNFGKTWIKKYYGIFTEIITWLWFQSRSIIGYYHLPTSTQPTQRISTAVLYGGLLCDTISCMWWWDWTTEHICRSRPLTLSGFLSLTMQPRHYVYCSIWTY